MAINFIQAQPFKLAGAGSSISDTTLILQSMIGIEGSNIVTADLGDVCYGTIEPGNGTQEEAFQFTGVTQNANGTATLTGVSTILFKQPYTATSGLTKVHPGAATVILSNDAAFYNNIISYVNGVAIAGASNASSTAKGIVELATAAEINAGTATGGTGAALVVTPDQLILSNYVPTIPSGAIVPFGGRTAPSNWLLCDGTAVSRATYAALFTAIAPSGTFTVTIASPAVLSKTAHGLIAGDKISFTTTGALPTGLSVNTDYFVISAGLATDSFEVSASRGGSAVNTSGTQSGTHTLYATNHGKGDGSTTFNLPDFRGFTPYGQKTSDANFDVINTPTTYAGEKTHQLTIAELAAHTHTISAGVSGSSSINVSSSGGSANIVQVNSTGSAGSDTAHNNLSPYIVTPFIIKT